MTLDYLQLINNIEDVSTQQVGVAFKCRIWHSSILVVANILTGYKVLALFCTCMYGSRKLKHHNAPRIREKSQKCNRLSKKFVNKKSQA